MNELLNFGASGQQQLLDKLEACRPWLWKNGEKVYNDEQYEINKANLVTFKEKISDCYSLGGNIRDNVFALCWKLYEIFLFSTGVNYISNDGVKHDYPFANGTFLYITETFGLSKSTAYAYKSVAEFMFDGHLVEGYENYSLSLLIELTSLLKFELGVFRLDNLCKFIPKGTTVDEVRLFKKIMHERNYRLGVFNKHEERCEKLPYLMVSSDLDKFPGFSEALKLYQTWLEEDENAKLEDKLSGKNVAAVETFAPKAEETEKVYLDGQEYTVPVKYQAFVRGLEEENDKLRLNAVPELGNCEGCQFKDKNLNKCRCCRRYKDLKDLYQK